jgi:hypothetical protein
MKPNVGTIDRILRIALGLGLIAASMLGTIGAWGWIGLLPLATGIFRFCPAYWPLGLSTCTSGTGSATP